MQLGFAGSRQLWDDAAPPPLDAAHLEQRLTTLLAERLTQFCAQLSLGPEHVVCGISQIAVGADAVFTRALQSLHWPQRIFLPQTRDQFLNAAGSGGPDFTPEQRQATERLLASPHIIQERVVSDSPDRETRFRDVNLEIAHVSDCVVCLLRASAADAPSLTRSLIDSTLARGRPVLELIVHLEQGEPRLEERFHPGEFTPPVLPEPLGTISTERACHDIEALRRLGSDEARRLQGRFRSGVAITTLTHLLATVLALAALVGHHLGWHAAVIGLLLVELICLGWGLRVHHELHHSKTVQHWALWRLVVQLADSVRAVGSRHLYLSYLYGLSFPGDLRPLLRTISLRHLQATRGAAAAPGDWRMDRDRYVAQRIDDAARGQLPYYTRQAAQARRQRTTARRWFWGASLAAMLMTTTKLLLPAVEGLLGHAPHVVPDVLGAFAVLLPLAAVAALSLAAAHDLDARANVYAEMQRYLERQRQALRGAVDARDYDRLLLETESRLLGETVNWYARRAYLS